MAKYTVSEKKGELQALRPHLSYESIEIGKAYHIPRVLNIDPMDVIVVGKVDDKIRFRIVGDTTNKEQEMHKSSVLSRFLVKRLRY